MAICMLNKVVSDNDHYSAFCIASHCAVVSVGAVPQCFSATLRLSEHTHHSFIFMIVYHVHSIFSPEFPGLLGLRHVQGRSTREMVQARHWTELPGRLRKTIVHCGLVGVIERKESKRGVTNVP